MRIKRSIPIPKGERVVLNVTCKVSRKCFVFRSKHRWRRINPRKVFIETTLYKLVKTWLKDLFAFNFMNNHLHFTHYRMVDLNRVPAHEREHALKMREILCPLPDVFGRGGWDVDGPSQNEYIEMLVIEGCKRTCLGLRIP